MTAVLMKRGNLDTHTQGECAVKMKAETGVIASKPPQTRREVWNRCLPRSSQKVKERKQKTITTKNLSRISPTHIIVKLLIKPKAKQKSEKQSEGKNRHTLFEG